MMQWQNLYSNIRSRENLNKTVQVDKFRTSYLKDFDRIIFSASFRKLQNKTQVFPLPGASVFVHNRLTHSLEVASVGRSLGKIVGEQIALKHSGDEHFKAFYQYELASVIAAAALAHDIGNPPFGHSGEDAIRNFFASKNPIWQDKFEQELTLNQQKDFLFFEGNANAFRTLTHAFNEHQSGGFKLTFATLASIVKYPCDATNGFDKKSGLIATQKMGFFDQEIKVFESIAQHFQLPKIAPNIYARHPYVFLVEAADDICYRIIDLEDAQRLGIITLQEFIDFFLPFFENETDFNALEKVKIKLNEIVDPSQKTQYLRAVWIGLMVKKAAEIFMENEQSILEGSFQNALLDCLSVDFKNLLHKIKQFSIEKIYNHPQVVQVEIAGFNIIGGLLEEFVTAIVSPQSLKSEKILQLIPNRFNISNVSFYQNLLSVVDFIADMTDLYALELFQKIKGVTL